MKQKFLVRNLEFRAEISEEVLENHLVNLMLI